jgi:hypothetical protein
MTLQDFLAGIFNGGAPQPAQAGGSTPNDIILQALGAPSAPAPATMPRAGSPTVAQSPLPPVTAPRPAQSASAPPTGQRGAPQVETGLGDYLTAFSEGLGGNGSISGAIGGLLNAGKGAGQVNQMNNATFDALIRKGIPEDQARAIISNPTIAKEVLPKIFAPPAAQERQIKEIFDEASGRKRMASVNPTTGEYLPVGGMEAEVPGSGPGGVNGPFKDTKERAGVEEGLRKEIASTTKDWSTIRDAHSKIRAVGSQPASAAGDMALIFGIMKLYDPGSVVRETEYATAENARGVPDHVANIWNKLRDGVRLTPEQRADFISQSDTLANSQAQRTKQVLEQYKGISERLGVDTRNVVLDDPETIGAIGAKPQAAAGGGAAIDEARAAIAKGAPREAVIQRLRERGISPEGL